ncbi:hypothetical protein Tco_0544002 [Tanacetum coccineum]
MSKALVPRILTGDKSMRYSGRFRDRYDVPKVDPTTDLVVTADPGRPVDPGRPADPVPADPVHVDPLHADVADWAGAEAK